MMPPRNEENHPWADHPLDGSSQSAIPQATNRKTPAPRRSRIFFTSFTKFFFSPSFSSFGYPTRHESSPQKLSHNVARCRTMSQDAQVNMCYNVNCQRRTRTQDAAQQQRKPSMGSSSSCRPLTKHRFTSNLVVAYDGILTLQYWESSVPWHESSP